MEPKLQEGVGRGNHLPIPQLRDLQEGWSTTLLNPEYFYDLQKGIRATTTGSDPKQIRSEERKISLVEGQEMMWGRILSVPFRFGEKGDDSAGMSG